MIIFLSRRITATEWACLSSVYRKASPYRRPPSSATDTTTLRSSRYRVPPFWTTDTNAWRRSSRYRTPPSFETYTSTLVWCTASPRLSTASTRVIGCDEDDGDDNYVDLGFICIFLVPYRLPSDSFSINHVNAIMLPSFTVTPLTTRWYQLLAATYQMVSVTVQQMVLVADNLPADGAGLRNTWVAWVYRPYKRVSVWCASPY